jgi:hypothetical protein
MDLVPRKPVTRFRHVSVIPVVKEVSEGQILVGTDRTGEEYRTRVFLTVIRLSTRL